MGEAEPAHKSKNKAFRQRDARPSDSSSSPGSTREEVSKETERAGNFCNELASGGCEMGHAVASPSLHYPS
jgi:hypothetical protein